MVFPWLVKNSVIDAKGSVCSMCYCSDTNDDNIHNNNKNHNNNDHDDPAHVSNSTERTADIRCLCHNCCRCWWYSTGAQW